MIKLKKMEIKNYLKIHINTPPSLMTTDVGRSCRSQSGVARVAM